MAGLRRATQHPRLCFIICVSAISFILFSQVFRDRRQDERHTRDIEASTESPAEHIDPAAIDLTPLVNTLINTSQSGSRQLFSLLSVTSYSSLALHKLTLLVYNISSIRSIESNKFRRRFCYCVTNETNDLTDFTAILLDVMGNSTSYLHELFKSASILSVSQRNNSDCIYICVMAGKMGRELSELWEVDAITPLFNQTIIEGPHTAGNVSSIRLPVEWHQLPTNLSHISPSGMSSRVHSTAHVSPTTLDETAATTAKITTVQLLTTAGRPTTITPQSQSTADRLETTRRATTQTVTAQTVTAQTVTTQTVTTQTVTAQTVTAAQTKASEQPTTTTLQPLTSPASLQLTTVSVTTAAAPTIVTTSSTRLTTASARPTSFSPGHSLTRLTTTSSRPSTFSPGHSLTRLTPASARPTTFSPGHSLTRLTPASARPTTFSPGHSLTRLTTATQHPTTTTERTTSTVHPTRLPSVRPTARPVVARGTTGALSRRTTTPSKPVEKPGCPWRRPEPADASSSGSTTTVSAHKLQPCVLELCKFFSQCLCGPFSHKMRMKRYCDDSHVWYEKHTSEVCQRVRRLSFSRSLKQRCLTKMCNKL